MNLQQIIHSIDTSPGRLLAHIVFTLVIAFIITLLLRPVINFFVRRIVGKHVQMKKAERKKRINTLATVFYAVGSSIVWIVAVFVILNQLHVNLAATLTGAGLVGVLIGFGAQNLISDILAGIFIIGENQYRVGDIVALRVGSQDVSGVVEAITIRITRLRDLDGNVHIVRNGVAQAVSNLSFDYANVNVDVGVSYDTDVDQVETILNAVGIELAKDPKWAPYIIEPIQFLRLDGFEDSRVRIKSLGKVEAAEQWNVAGEYRRRLKKAFEAAGVSMPLPQLDIHTDTITKPHHAAK